MNTPASAPPEARLGNDIARQFAHLPADQAAEAVAQHLETFWPPSMRHTLEALAAAQDPSLDPLLGAAARLVAAHEAGSA